MKGLLLKEWYSLTGMSNFKVLLLFILVFMGFGAAGSVWMFIYLPIIASMMPRTLLIYDENSKWQQFSLAMPYNRKDFVSVKYLATFFLCTVCAALSGIVCAASMIVRSNFDGNMLALLVCGGIGGGLLIPAFALPIDLKFGSAKGKIFTLIYGGLLGCAGGLLASMSGSEDGFNMAALPNEGILAASILAVSLILFGISWIISIALYEKREF